MTVVGNTIENNVLAGQDIGNGGLGAAGIYIDGEGTTVVENNIIRNNFTKYGVGAAISTGGNGPYYIVQNLIYDNIGGCGAGALSLAPTHTFIANNTIANNTGPTQARGCGQSTSQIDLGDGFGGLSGPDVTFYNNIIIAASAYPAISCYQNGPPLAATQPLFQIMFFTTHPDLSSTRTASTFQSTTAISQPIPSL